LDAKAIQNVKIPILCHKKDIFQKLIKYAITAKHLLYELKAKGKNHGKCV
jgi:hypothetical protein